MFDTHYVHNLVRLLELLTLILHRNHYIKPMKNAYAIADKQKIHILHSFPAVVNAVIRKPRNNSSDFRPDFHKSDFTGMTTAS